MENIRQNYPADEIKPPVTHVGVVGWIRTNLFKGWFNSLLTVITIYCLWVILPPLIRWAFIDSRWISTGAECNQAGGACWSVITANIRFITFGFFPYEQQWRPFVAMALLVALLFYSRNRNHWKKQLSYAWILGLFIMGLLMKGGLFGLAPVESAQWGGLPLTLLLSVFGLTAAYPLGVILALGRRSKMPAVKTLCIIYIEFIRGVPLISVLFMSQLMLPLFLPPAIRIGTVLRALTGMTLFSAAYTAENVRGGLAAVPMGQYEAGTAVGLNKVLLMVLIVLPQALRNVIPAIVGQFISLLKDTTLVVIVGLLDVLGIAKAVTGQRQFIGLHMEVYSFAALLFFVFCYTLSRASRRLEKRLGVGER